MKKQGWKWKKQGFITFSEQHILQNIEKNSLKKQNKLTFRSFLPFPDFKQANNANSTPKCAS